MSIGIKIAASNIPGAGLRTFAIKNFPTNTFFGLNIGERHTSAERANQSSYVNYQIKYFKKGWNSFMIGMNYRRC